MNSEQIQCIVSELEYLLHKIELIKERLRGGYPLNDSPLDASKVKYMLGQYQVYCNTR